MKKRLRDAEGLKSLIKERVNIIDVFKKADIEVTRSGALWECLCFQHEETKASLKIDEERGLFNCFGSCGAKGDTIRFVEMYYRKNYVEALLWLADFAKIDTKPYMRKLTKEEEQIDRYLRLYDYTVTWCQEQIDKHKRAREFLYEERGLRPTAILEHRIGYCPNVELLKSHLIQKRGANMSELRMLDLIRDDVFTDAIIYPVANSNGQIVNIYGRSFEHGYRGLSSDRPIAAIPVFGLDVAMDATEGCGIIVVEGQNDVLQLNSHGVINVVAMLGGSLDKESIEEFRQRNMMPVTMIFDGDKGGRKHLDSAIVRFSNDLDVKMFVLGENDPDEYLRMFGVDEFMKCVDFARTSVEWLAGRIILDYEPESPMKDKIDVLKRARETLKGIHLLAYDLIIDEMTKKLDMSRASIADYLTSSRKDKLESIDSERIVLSAMYHDVLFRMKAADGLCAEAFVLVKHRIMYGALLGFKHSDVDMSLVMEAISQRRGSEEVISKADVKTIIAADHTKAEGHLDVVLDKHMRRGLREMSSNINASVHDYTKPIERSIDDIANSAVRLVVDRESDNTSSYEQTNSAVELMFDRAEHKRDIIGVDMGDAWKQTCYAIGGLQKGHSISIAANQGVGKSAMMNNLLVEIGYKQKRPCLCVSMEMYPHDLIYRHLSIITGYAATAITRGALKKAQMQKVTDVASDYMKSPVFTYPRRSVNLNRLVSVVRRHVLEFGVEIAFIDYLQLIDVSDMGRIPRHERIGHVSEVIKTKLAGDLGIPIVSLCQLAKEAENEAVAHASNVAGAYKIAQDADEFLILQRKSDKLIRQQGPSRGGHIVNVDKSRLSVSQLMFNVQFNCGEGGNLRMFEAKGGEVANADSD